MTSSRTAHRTRIVMACVLGLAACGPLLAAPGDSAQAAIASALCPVIAKLLPEVRGYQPEGVRAQLVMAVAEKFDYDGPRLRQVTAEADAGTTASCPKDREALLGILQTRSLSEALF